MPSGRCQRRQQPDCQASICAKRILAGSLCCEPATEELSSVSLPLHVKEACALRSINQHSLARRFASRKLLQAHGKGTAR